MTRDDIIRMAREATDHLPDADSIRLQGIVLLALDAGAADEREACVNIDWTPILRNNGMVTWGDAETLADLVSTAIRARGQG